MHRVSRKVCWVVGGGKGSCGQVGRGMWGEGVQV